MDSTYTDSIAVPLCDLKYQYLQYKQEIDKAISRVLHSGQYVAGKEVAEFEEKWAAHCNAKYCIGVSSGTDALYLALRALKIYGRIDKVLTTPLTFFATVQAILHADMIPVFMDVDQNTAVINVPESCYGVFQAAIPVSLYGHPVSIPGMRNYPVIEDAAQHHGATLKSTAMCTSFYPTKNLGAFGQAGAVVTNDEGLAEEIRLLRTYGEKGRFVHYADTGNYRMDEIQAAVLNVKYYFLNIDNLVRTQIAAAYRSRLRILPYIKLQEDSLHHSYHAFVIRTKYRDELAEYLSNMGVQTAVRYPVPMHKQPALEFLLYSKLNFPHAEAWARENLNLPIWPGMSVGQIDYVVGCIEKKVDEWTGRRLDT